MNFRLNPINQNLTEQRYLHAIAGMLHNFWIYLYNSHIFEPYKAFVLEVFKVGRGYAGNFFKLSR
jgi:hypothetical protein